MPDRNGRRQRRSELGDAAPPQPRALQLPEPAAQRPRRAAATLEAGKCAESPGSVANEALAEPGHSANDADGAVAAANNAGGDYYDNGASDTEHFPSRLSGLGCS